MTAVGFHDLLGTMNISNARTKNSTRTSLLPPKFAIQATFFKLSPSFAAKYINFKVTVCEESARLKRAALNQELADSAAKQLELPSPRWLIVLRAITTDGTQSSAKVSPPPPCRRCCCQERREKEEIQATSEKTLRSTRPEEHGLCAHTEPAR